MDYKKDEKMTYTEKQGVRASIEVKHVKNDLITGTTTITLGFEIDVNTGTKLSGKLNLNNVTSEQYEALMKQIGIDGLNENTKLTAKIEIPTGAILDHWSKNKSEPDNTTQL